MSTLIGMPAQYEMLVSHSPPVFSHSPPAGFLNDYTSSNNRLYDPTRSLFRPNQHMLGPVRSQSLLTFAQLKKKMPTSPIRSCLAVKAEVAAEPTNETTGGAPNAEQQNKIKKRVVFADDEGYSLTEVRIMSEPSSVPPLWSLEFLAHVTQGMVSPVPIEQWTVTFRQPASDYLDFRQTLDTKNVSLENVIVKENECCVVGTVKVRNLSFTKEVIVRTSSDNWKTQEDTFCTYSTVGGAGGYVLYDTFSFKMTLPPVSRKIEFCVCFRVNNTEYWDNNDGKNYVITKRSTGCGLDSATEYTKRPQQTDHGKKECCSPLTSAPMNIPNKYTDIAQAKISTWSEFASWNHFEHEDADRASKHRPTPA